MKKNIFLTGERQVGKSTLIAKTLAHIERAESPPLSVGGFVTRPLPLESARPGFGILPAMILIEPVVIAYKNPDGSLEKFPAAFEETGVKILQGSLEQKPHILIMDELGFLENEAFLFQEAVMRCLDSSVPVFGVMKPLATPFLDKIRQRSDVRLIEVTPDNRNALSAILPELVFLTLRS